MISNARAPPRPARIGGELAVQRRHDAPPAMAARAGAPVARSLCRHRVPSRGHDAHVPDRGRPGPQGAPPIPAAPSLPRHAHNPVRAPKTAQRLSASPGTPERGRLSVMAQRLCEVRNVYEVPSTAFVPAPKVRSALPPRTLRKRLNLGPCAGRDTRRSRARSCASSHWPSRSLSVRIAPLVGRRAGLNSVVRGDVPHGLGRVGGGVGGRPQGPLPRAAQDPAPQPSVPRCACPVPCAGHLCPALILANADCLCPGAGAICRPRSRRSPRRPASIRSCGPRR